MPNDPSATWRWLKTLAAWPLALLILFEEWGWAPLARLLGIVARHPLFAWIERRISALGPVPAVLALFVPMLFLLPIKIGAWWLIARGKAMTGVAVLVVAKILGTAVVARIFLLTRPQLLRLGWFARCYARWLDWKARVLAHVRASFPWRAARQARDRLAAAWNRG
jgi:hypothetical protein